MAVQLEFLKSILYFSDLGLAELESMHLQFLIGYSRLMARIVSC
jgi:hypothetical protein